VFYAGVEGSRRKKRPQESPRDISAGGRTSRTYLICLDLVKPVNSSSEPLLEIREAFIKRAQHEPLASCISKHCEGRKFGFVFGSNERQLQRLQTQLSSISG